MTPFEKALEHVLEREGGYVDHPDDRGGPTNFGITIGTLARWRGRIVTRDDVKSIPKSEVVAIYKVRYWDACGLDQIESDKIALCIFDQAVNRGVKPAVKQAQMVGEDLSEIALLIDGVLGPRSANAINVVNPTSFCMAYIDASREYYRRLAARVPRQKTFLKGWLNRMDALQKAVV